MKFTPKLVALLFAALAVASVLGSKETDPEKQYERQDFGITLGAFAVVATISAVSTVITSLQTSERVISVWNIKGEDVTVECKDANESKGVLTLPTGKAYAFMFDRNFWGVSHFWCKVFEQSGKFYKFPAYNEGAPNDNNVFKLMPDGVYLLTDGDHMENFEGQVHYFHQ